MQDYNSMVLSGFTEGCELLANVIVTYWDSLWPEKPNQRTEVLNWFNTKLKASALLRQQSYQAKDLTINLSFRARVTVNNR